MDFAEILKTIDIDREATLQRLGGIEELLKKFLLRFLDDNSYQTFLNGTKQGDFDQAFRGLHTLKGLSGNLGISKLYSLCSEGVEFMRNKDSFLPEDSALYTDIQAEYERVIKTLTDYKDMI